MPRCSPSMSPARCPHHALPGMIERKYGRIINLSSQLAQRAVSSGGFAGCAATKGAVESFTRALAAEVGQHGITVNAISPGGIETDISKNVMTPEYRTRRLGELPLRRFGSVEDCLPRNKSGPARETRVPDCLQGNDSLANTCWTRR